MLRWWILLLACSTAIADERARAVAEAEYAASHGYGDLQAEIEMVLISKKGRASERALRLKQIEVPGSVKTLIVFDEPKPIRGTGLLTFSQPLEDDDQWLYLPSIKRVKKIASKDRSGPFVGSEFSYEDLADYTVDEFRYAYLREEACGELVCDVIQRTPVDPFSGYSHHVVWIDQTSTRIRQVEFFDENQSLKKRLTSTDFRAYAVGDRTFTQPHRLHMQNLQTGRQTTLTWRAYEYAQGLVESRDFTTNALRRVR